MLRDLKRLPYPERLEMFIALSNQYTGRELSEPLYRASLKSINWPDINQCVRDYAPPTFQSDEDRRYNASVVWLKDYRRK